LGLKVPGSKASRPLFYCGWKVSSGWVWSGPISRRKLVKSVPQRNVFKISFAVHRGYDPYVQKRRSDAFPGAPNNTFASPSHLNIGPDQEMRYNINPTTSFYTQTFKLLMLSDYATAQKIETWNSNDFVPISMIICGNNQGNKSSSSRNLKNYWPTRIFYNWITLINYPVNNLDFSNYRSLGRFIIGSPSKHSVINWERILSLDIC